MVSFAVATFFGRRLTWFCREVASRLATMNVPEREQTTMKAVENQPVFLYAIIRRLVTNLENFSAWLMEDWTRYVGRKRVRPMVARQQAMWSKKESRVEAPFYQLLKEKQHS